MKHTCLVIAVLGLALAGCGYAGGGAGASASRLVTAEDAERILGGAAKLVAESSGEAESPPGGRESHCEYVGPDRATLNAVMREIGVYTVKNGKVVSEEFMYDVSGA